MPHSLRILPLLAATLGLVSPLGAQHSGTPESYGKLCASCHGESAAGTERGPALVDNRALRGRTEKQIGNLIRNGSPGRMPPFPLPDDQLQPLARWVRSLNVSAGESAPVGDAAAGERFFFGKGRCG